MITAAAPLPVSAPLMCRPMITAAAPSPVSAPLSFATPKPDRLASLAVIFDRWDVDKSATLDLEEIKSGLKELGIPVSDAALAKLFLDLVSRDEYDDEICVSEKVVSLSEWLDNLPDTLADEIITRSAIRLLHTAEAPYSWKKHVQKSIHERLSVTDAGSTVKTNLSPLIHVFNEWDTDNSKTIDLSELKAGLRQLGIVYDNEAVEAMFRSLCNAYNDPIDEMDEIKYHFTIDLSQRSVSIIDWLNECPADLQETIQDAVMKSR
jgi:Ca2+-binding EF-hand superfamily protein